MSLKAIKELLSSYEDCIGKSDSEIGTAAQAEIAALEKAAKIISQWRDRPASVSWNDIAGACDAMETIAKEAE